MAPAVIEVRAPWKLRIANNFSLQVGAATDEDDGGNGLVTNDGHQPGKIEEHERNLRKQQKVLESKRKNATSLVDGYVSMLRCHARYIIAFIVLIGLSTGSTYTIM